MWVGNYRRVGSKMRTKNEKGKSGEQKTGERKR